MEYIILAMVVSLRKQEALASTQAQKLIMVAKLFSPHLQARAIAYKDGIVMPIALHLSVMVRTPLTPSVP